MRMVLHQGKFSSGWSGLSSGCRWSLIMMVVSNLWVVSNIWVVSDQDGLLSKWPVIEMVCHQDGFSSRPPFIRAHSHFIIPLKL